MKKINVFLSSTMTGELDKERETLKIFFNADPALKDFYELYQIENHASPRKIDKAYKDEVEQADIFLILLDTELRTAVEEEYFHAIQHNKKIFCYIKNNSTSRDKALGNFIQDEIYKYHPSHYVTCTDLCNRIKTDFQNDIIRIYNSTIQEKESNEDLNYMKSTSASEDTPYRYFPLNDLLNFSNNAELASLTIDQLISLSSIIVKEQGNYKIGLMLLEIGLIKDPKNWILHNNRGLLLDSMGLSNLSMYSYETAILNNPNSDTAYFNYGNSYYKLGVYKTALSYYQKSLELKPDKSNAISRISASYLRLKDPANSLKWTKISYEKESNDISTSNYAIALALNGKFEKAEKYLEKISNKCKYDDAKIYIYRKSGKFNKAIDIINTLDKNGTLEYNNALQKFYCLIELGSELDVQNWVYEIENRFPINPWDYNNIGYNIFEKFGKSIFAVKLYRKALKLDPTMLTAWQNLQYNLHELGELELGLDACNEALKIQPFDPKSIKNKSLFLQELNRFDELIRFNLSKTFGVLGNDELIHQTDKIMNETYTELGFNTKEKFESLIKSFIDIQRDSKI